jgi:hypothetical protein
MEKPPAQTEQMHPAMQEAWGKAMVDSGVCDGDLSLVREGKQHQKK